MKKRNKTIILRLATYIFLTLGLCSVASARNKEPAVTLSVQGQKLEKDYIDILTSLETEVSAALPATDKTKVDAFLEARAAFDSIKPPGETASPTARIEHEKLKEQAEAKVMSSSRSLLAELDALLASDNLDSKLMKAAIIGNATPRGLAEFAQQGDLEKGLLDKLFADEALMKQILVSGGANGGEFGEAMQVYEAILAKSERAREVGSIFQRLALGTALHQPWLEGKENGGGVHGILLADHTTPDGPVARYLHYEKAYLDGELDPAFKDMNAWECRFITNDPSYTNEELSWAREMMRNFRPDHITNPDHKWRYTRLVKSDVPYTSTRHDPALGTPAQQAIALGGVCGRRAFFGRFVTRAFGIPSRRSTQTGHAAMNRWTPDGWTVNFGGWWSINWCGPWGGLDFFLDSRAREFSEDYMQVLRAQWIGDALGEEDVSIRQYGRGGGLWNGIAFYKKRAVVADAEVTEQESELANLTAEEARLLGESDAILGDNKEKEEVEIPEEDRKIIIGDDGVIKIPAAACSKPKTSTDKIAFMKSWDGGTQVHYSRLGNRPELLSYTVEAPTSGKYEIVAQVATVSPKQQVILRLNRRTLVDLSLPYTKGMWQESEPVTIDLREGRNSLMFTARAPNRGVSVKELTLKPVK